MKPKFIVIEGGEGSGKSSMLKELKTVLGDSVLFTREPGGSPYAEAIRQMALTNPLAKNAPPETTLCLMFAARYDHIANVIKPALAAGKPVISDRFDGSSYAYNVVAQSDYTLGLTFWDLRGILDIFPDLYVYLDVEPLQGLKRVQARRQAEGIAGSYDHFDDRKAEFHKKVRQGYLEFLQHREDGQDIIPHIIIDANRPLEEVRLDFVHKIKGVLNI